MIGQRILLLAKFCASIAFLTWILRGTQLMEVWQALSRARLRFVVMALGLNFVGYLILCTRWRILLRAQGVRVKIGYLLRSFMVALFFNNLLPSTIGGDAVRVHDSWKAGAGRVQALTVVFVDRLLGLLSLLTFVAVAFLVWKVQQPSAVPLGGGLVTLIALGGVAGTWVLVVAPGFLVELGQRFKNPLGRRLARVISHVAESLALFRRHPRALRQGAGLSLLLQINVVAHYYLLAVALSLPIPIVALFFVVPFALLVMMLPVSINGIGIRENAFVVLLGPFGVSQAEGIAFSWLAYGLILFQGFLGAVVYTIRREPIQGIGDNDTGSGSFEDSKKLLHLDDETF